MKHYTLGVAFKINTSYDNKLWITSCIGGNNNNTLFKHWSEYECSVVFHNFMSNNTSYVFHNKITFSEMFVTMKSCIQI